MIYATTHPIEEYGVTVDGYRVGLYDTYMDRPTLLALICMVTPLPFDYEGCRKINNRRVQLMPEAEGSLMLTLACELGGKTVEHLLETLNPLDFWNYIHQQDVERLPIVRGMLGGSVDALMLITAARATAWALHYRGPVGQHRNVFQLAFRGITVPDKMKESYEKLKEEFTE